MNAAYTTPPEASRYQQWALIVGAVFTVILALGFFLSPREMFFSLVPAAYVFWIVLPWGVWRF